MSQFNVLVWHDLNTAKASDHASVNIHGSSIFLWDALSGYILKKDKKKMEDQRETISLEDLVDKERGALVGRDLNKITLESFLKWKKRKIEEKKSKAKDEAKKKKQDMDSGNLSKLTGELHFSQCRIQRFF